MSLKYRINPQLLAARDRQQHVAGLVGPVEGERGGVGDEEVVEGDGGVDGHEGVAHARPGEMVDPGRVGGGELGGSGGDPGGEAGMGGCGGGDLPPHEEEHYVAGRCGLGLGGC